ncbi:MAG TPA: class I SAM-dependent methyltransferase [Nitrososphaera sp.]|nr:class I SAM-dependent methyltransferase [Nitrososphaera sp.]
MAWDCATGNGQAATVLANQFERVIASDISAKQIENAHKRSNVAYEIFPAERTPLEDESIDLITVAQALHWFDFGQFYREVRRVLRKGGIISAWAYGHHRISPAIDRVSHKLYKDILGTEYWPKEIEYIEGEYRDIPFPFEQIAVPQFHIQLSWNLPELLNYLHTWSSVQKYMEKNGDDPVTQVSDELKEAWREGTVRGAEGETAIDRKKRLVTWPLYVKIGRIQE